MINNGKINENYKPNQIAGLLPNDSNIEFFGIRATKKVMWMRNGHSNTWENLPTHIFNACKKQFLNDFKAKQELSLITKDTNRQVELYIYHLYGSLNSTPDFVNGQLQPSENFRHTKNDSALHWDSKFIKIDGVALTNRDLRIIDSFIEDIPDKAIAAEMGISQSTLDFHKHNLYKKLNCTSKVEVIVKAMNQQIN